MPAAGVEPADGVYDFDEIYDRVGTNCSKWDNQIKKYGRENIEVAMGVDQEALQAKTRYQQAKQDYLDSRRELINSNSDFNGHRSQIKLAYQNVEDARRDAAAKGRIVQQYKDLIKTATFQRQTLGAGTAKSTGNRARRAKKGKSRKKK